MEVEYPGMRRELGIILTRLSNPLYQWEKWIEKKDIPDNQILSFSEPMHFILDSALGDDPYSQIGIILKTEEEAEAIIVLYNALMHAIKSVGKRASDEDFLKHSSWMEVLRTAHEALIVFTRAEYGYPVKPQ